MNEAQDPIHLTINGSSYDVDVDPQMPLLWVLRDELGLVGTKYSCGLGLCGSCSVLVDGVQVRSCTIPVMDIEGEVTTIEGLGNPDSPNAVQRAWIEHQVAQCGYCQSGQIIAAQALLAVNPSPTDQDIDDNILNVCRCATYYRMRKAIHRAAAMGERSLE